MLKIFRPTNVISFSCILTLDRTVNQRFSAKDTPVKIGGSSHVVERKCVVVMKWYMKIPTWDTGCLSLEIVSACGYKKVTGAPASGWAPRGGNSPERASGWVPPPRRQRSRRSAKWSFEDNTAWYGQKMKLGLIWQSVFVSICLSHTYRSFQPFREQRENYSFIIKCCGFFFIPYIYSSPIMLLYNIFQWSNK